MAKLLQFFQLFKNVPIFSPPLKKNTKCFEPQEGLLEKVEKNHKNGVGVCGGLQEMRECPCKILLALDTPYNLGASPFQQALDFDVSCRITVRKQSEQQQQMLVRQFIPTLWKNEIDSLLHRNIWLSYCKSTVTASTAKRQQN
ncbi:MAG: hypothetical protein Q4E41_02555 [Bacteroidales bacterium]|nr:hypothetical protein [Bacteroidales bacterium]